MSSSRRRSPRARRSHSSTQTSTRPPSGPAARATRCWPSCRMTCAIRSAPSRCARARSADAVPPSTDGRALDGRHHPASRLPDWAQRIIRDLLDVTSLEAGRLFHFVASRWTQGRVLTASAALFATQGGCSGRSTCERSRGRGAATMIDADAEQGFSRWGQPARQRARGFTSRGGSVTIGVAGAEHAGDAVRFSVWRTPAPAVRRDTCRTSSINWQLQRTHRGGTVLETMRRPWRCGGERGAVLCMTRFSIRPAHRRTGTRRCRAAGRSRGSF